MNLSKKYIALADTMRKTAQAMQALRVKRNRVKMEKCAATVVARVGLEELKKRLTTIR